MASKRASNPADEKRFLELLAKPPPRIVPREFCVPVSFGLVLFGVVCLLVSVALVCLFFPWGFWHDWQLDKSAVRAVGQVSTVIETNLGEGGGRHAPSHPIYEYDFVFTPPGGTMVHAACYTTNHALAKEHAYVNVEYLPDYPAVARIVNARTTTVSTSGMFVVVFPIAAFGIFFGIWGRRRWVIWFFRHGLLVETRVFSVEATGKKGLFNRLPFYKITLIRTDNPDGPPLTSCEWDEDIIKLAKECCGSEKQMYVLQDPQKPLRLLLLLPYAWTQM